jgi:predicted lipoprotein with Yx(FWY)xxD motif
MNTRFASITFITAIALAACGGGNTGSVGGGGGGTVAPPVVATPTPPPQVTPQGNTPLSESVGSSPAWVNPTTHHTLYFLDVDTATTQLCTAASGCLPVWPIFAPTAGATAGGNMTIITRSDGAGQQWAYQGHPLYNFSGDNGADQANGDGLPDFGGHWHVARPTAATPPPVGGPPPCTGPYC